MKQTIIGGGYVGLVLAAVLAKHFPTHIVDIDETRIAALRAGECPIHEPNLDVRLRDHGFGGRLTAGTKHAPDPSVYWLCVGTPELLGNLDLRPMLEAVDVLREHLEEIGETSAVVIIKSTVPPRTGHQMELMLNMSGASHRVVSCPEFLREGSAVSDMLNPDRVVIGADDHEAGMTVAGVMEVVTPATPIYMMRRVEAELVKVAANAMLATRISFANSIAMLADKTGARAHKVLEAVGADRRIGHSFMRPGLGYGGSCFPKDVIGLAAACNLNGTDARLIRAVSKVNDMMVRYAAGKLTTALKGLKGKRIAILGVAFKPDTDDQRNSPGLGLASWLVNEGASVVLVDPVVTRASIQIHGKNPQRHMVSHNWPVAVKGSDAIVLATEWKYFASIRPEEMLRHCPTLKVVLDGRGDWYKHRLTYKAFGVTALGIGYPDAKPDLLDDADLDALYEKTEQVLAKHEPVDGVDKPVDTSTADSIISLTRESDSPSQRAQRMLDRLTPPGNAPELSLIEGGKE